MIVQDEGTRGQEEGTGGGDDGTGGGDKGTGEVSEISHQVYIV